MKMYAGCASNLLLDEPTEGKTGAIVEIVIIAADAEYIVSADGVTKMRRLDDMRFVASPHGLRELAEYLIKQAERAEEMAANVNGALSAA